MWHSRQKKRVIAALTDSRQKKRVNHFQARLCPIKIKHKSSFFNPAPKERPLDFNKDSNNHICWRQMLYKGLVIIITASFSDCKTFGKSLRISVKFCHWNPKNSEILSKLRNSELCGASGASSCEQELCEPISLLHFSHAFSCEQELCEPISLSRSELRDWLTRPLLGSARHASGPALYATLLLGTSSNRGWNPFWEEVWRLCMKR